MSTVADVPAITTAAAHLSRPVLVGVFGGALAGLLAVAAIAFVTAESGPGRAACDPGRPCAPPPVGLPPLATGVTWTSSLGLRAEYGDEQWTVREKSATTLKLEKHDVVLWLDVEPSSKASPRQLFETRLQALRKDVPDLAEDDQPEHRLLGAAIGYHSGVGGSFVGTTFRSPRTRMSVVVMAASNGGVTAVASAMTGITDWFRTTRDDKRNTLRIFGLPDLVLDSVRWPSSGGTS